MGSEEKRVVPPEDTGKGFSEAPVTITVTYTGNKPSIVVSDSRIHVFRKSASGTKPGSVRWTAKGLRDTDVLHIDGTDNYFPTRDKEIRPPMKTAWSGRPVKLGEWKYKLRVAPANSPGGDLASLDPEVIIED